MPVLRYSGDTSIGQSLGNIGSALGQALDPKLRAQAQMLQIEMQLHLLQMRELQRKFGARDDLKRIYANLPPDRQAKFNYMIEGDKPMSDIEKEYGLQALTDPSSDHLTPDQIKSNIANTMRLTGQPYDKTYAPITGPATMGAAGEAQQRQKFGEAKATARGTLEGGGVKQNEPITLPPGERYGGGPQPINPLTGAPASGAATQAPPAQIPPVSPVAQAAPASSGSTADLTSGNSGANANAGSGGLGTSMFAVPPVSHIDPTTNQQTIGVSEADKARAAAGVKMVTDEGAAAQNKLNGVYKVRAVIDQIHQLQKIAQTSGWKGQLDAAVRNALTSEFHFTPTQAGTAQQAIQTLAFETLPAIRSAYGLTKIAGPEIQGVVKPVIGEGTMQPSVMNTILAQESAGSDIDEQDALNAQKMITGQMAPDQYFSTKATNAAKIPGLVDAYNKSANDIVAQAQQVQPQSTPQAQPVPPNAPSFWSWVFGGNNAVAGQAPQAPAPQAPPAFDPSVGGHY